MNMFTAYFRSKCKFLFVLLLDSLTTLMNTQSFKGRRRSTRNKTIVIDPRDLEDESPNTSSFTNISIIRSQNVNNDSIESRTFSFKELMSAFQTIEKRSSEDPYVVSNVLKKFKTNEEQSVETEYNEEKIKIEMEIFPKIMSNPFLRNDFEVPLDKIEKDQKKYYRNTNKKFQ